MKTMKKEENVVRVNEGQVDEHLKQGFKFCPKKEFKKSDTIK
jgi:hypothetical protein